MGSYRKAKEKGKKTKGTEDEGWGRAGPIQCPRFFPLLTKMPLSWAPISILVDGSSKNMVQCRGNLGILVVG